MIADYYIIQKISYVISKEIPGVIKINLFNYPFEIER